MKVTTRTLLAIITAGAVFLSIAGWRVEEAAASADTLFQRQLDLPADPGEATDLSEKHPETFAEFRRAYDAWVTKTEGWQS